MATFQPADRHLRATEEPAAPVPMTMRSNVMLYEVLTHKARMLGDGWTRRRGLR